MRALRYNILITKQCADLFHFWLVGWCSTILFISVGRLAHFTHSYVCYYNARYSWTKYFKQLILYHFLFNSYGANVAGARQRR